jgi:hypothetical protein
MDDALTPGHPVDDHIEETAGHRPEKADKERPEMERQPQRSVVAVEFVFPVHRDSPVP